jgi:hypothetical protein
MCETAAAFTSLKSTARQEKHGHVMFLSGLCEHPAVVDGRDIWNYAGDADAQTCQLNLLATAEER